jgi:hypothetical protein
MPVLTLASDHSSEEAISWGDDGKLYLSGRREYPLHMQMIASQSH